MCERRCFWYHTTRSVISSEHHSFLSYSNESWFYTLCLCNALLFHALSVEQLNHETNFSVSSIFCSKFYEWLFKPYEGFEVDELNEQVDTSLANTIYFKS